MIWRKSIETKLVEAWAPASAALVDFTGKPFDPNQARMITFGWTLASLADQEVWRRLAGGDFGPEGWRRSLVLSGWKDDARTELEDCLSPSEKGQFLLWIDPEGTLFDSLQPEDEDSCAAWNPHGGLLALGMATENAWEAMADSLARKK